MLQVTPVIAIAPLLLVWLEPSTAVLVCAFLVAFFPGAGQYGDGAGLDRSQSCRPVRNLSRARAGRPCCCCACPLRCPFFSGLRIAGGLALIGAIVAELAAGAAGQGSGLAFRIVEAGFRLNIPRMFAALALISATGIAIYAFFSLLSALFLGRWHERAGGKPGAVVRAEVVRHVSRTWPLPACLFRAFAGRHARATR